jgi:hypothetical protein
MTKSFSRVNGEWIATGGEASRDGGTCYLEKTFQQLNRTNDGIQIERHYSSRTLKLSPNENCDIKESVDIPCKMVDIIKAQRINKNQKR